MFYKNKRQERNASEMCDQERKLSYPAESTGKVS